MSKVLFHLFFNLKLDAYILTEYKKCTDLHSEKYLNYNGFNRTTDYNPRISPYLTKVNREIGIY